jgi:hypothetical protein
LQKYFSVLNMALKSATKRRLSFDVDEEEESNGRSIKARKMFASAEKRLNVRMFPSPRTSTPLKASKNAYKLRVLKSGQSLDDFTPIRVDELDYTSSESETVCGHSCCEDGSEDEGDYWDKATKTFSAIEIPCDCGCHNCVPVCRETCRNGNYCERVPADWCTCQTIHKLKRAETCLNCRHKLDDGEAERFYLDSLERGLENLKVVDWLNSNKLDLEKEKGQGDEGDNEGCNEREEGEIESDGQKTTEEGGSGLKPSGECSSFICYHCAPRGE